MSIHSKFSIRAVADSGDDDTFDFVLSDDTRDRYGDIIEASGWQLGAFRRNPICLYGHQGDRLPIGRWENVRVVANQLLGTLKLAKAGTSGFIDAIRELIKQRILNAVSVGFRDFKSEPIDADKPWSGTRYLKQELLECSVVSVPANPSAVIQRALKSFPTDVREKLLAVSGIPQSRPGAVHAKSGLSQLPRGDHQVSKKLAELIQEDRDELIQLNDEQAIYHDKIKDGESLTDDESAEFERIEADKEIVTKRLRQREATEKAIGASASRQPLVTAPPQPNGQQPGQQRTFATTKKEKPQDLLFKLATCHLRAFIERKPLETVQQELYGGRTDVEAIIKAVTNPAATTVAGWAAELVDTAILDFLDTLTPLSVYGQLSGMGLRFSFGRNGSVKIPRRIGGTGAGAAPDLRGAFVGEGQPIPVRRGNFGSITLVPHKMGVISTFTREMAQQSTPQIEAIIRQGITEDTALAIDTALLDAVAGDTIRPAGLLNGVTPLTATAGGGIAAITGDLAKLIGPYTTANAASGIVFLINPAKVFSLQWASTAVGLYPFREEANGGRLGGYPFIASTNVPANTIIAVRYADFLSSTADSPEWDVSDVATLHEDDGSYPADQAMRPGTSTVLPIVDGAGVAAKPQRSLWQTASIGIRMLLGMDWAMRRSGMVQVINNVTW